MSAWLRFLTISARSRANIEVGSFAGAAMPYHPATSDLGSASARLATGRFLGVVEPSLELADERESFRTARHRQRSMRCLPEP